MKIKKSVIFLSIVTALYFSIEFFGIISFFSWQMFVVTLLMLGLPIYGIIKIVYSIIIIFKHKKIRHALAVFSIGLWAIAIIPSGNWVNDMGLYFKLKANEQKLIPVCENILKTKEPNKYFWDDTFNLWPKFIGITRRSITHNNGIVYINIEGSPDNAAGFAFNPENKHMEIGKHIFGPWYSFYVSYD